jgi:hypothetical protein
MNDISAPLLDISHLLANLGAMVSGHRQQLVDAGFPDDAASAMAMTAYAQLLALMTTPGGSCDAS